MKKICKKIEKKEEPDLPGRRTTAPAARSIPAVSAPPRRAAPLWAWSLPPHCSLRPQESDPEKEKKREEKQSAMGEAASLARSAFSLGRRPSTGKESSSSVLRGAARAQAPVDPD